MTDKEFFNAFKTPHFVQDDDKKTS